MKLIHMEIAEPVAALARSKARRKSGAMAGSIKVSATTTMSRIQTGNKVYYPVQHFGWPGHNIAPNMFLTEAITEKTAETLRLYDQLLTKFIDDVWIETR